MVMTDNEIIQSYKWSKYPEKQIRILSELTLKSIPEIREIIGVEEMRRVNWTPELDAELMKLKSERKSWLEIAEMIGTTDVAVQSRYHKALKLTLPAMPKTTDNDDRRLDGYATIAEPRINEQQDNHLMDLILYILNSKAKVDRAITKTADGTVRIDIDYRPDVIEERKP